MVCHPVLIAANPSRLCSAVACSRYPLLFFSFYEVHFPKAGAGAGPVAGGAAHSGFSGRARRPPPANLQGQVLRDWLRTNWYDGKRTVLSYSAARAKMYNYPDNYNNSVTCVYSGYNTPDPFDFNS